MKKRQRDPSAKACPACYTLSYNGTRVCPGCGLEFYPKKGAKK